MIRPTSHWRRGEPQGFPWLRQLTRRRPRGRSETRQLFRMGKGGAPSGCRVRSAARTPFGARHSLAARKNRRKSSSFTRYPRLSNGTTAISTRRGSRKSRRSPSTQWFGGTTSRLSSRAREMAGTDRSMPYTSSPQEAQRRARGPLPQASSAAVRGGLPIREVATRKNVRASRDRSHENAAS